jgi:hypothetical protein
MTEPNPRLRSIWERFVNYELGHLHHVIGLFEKIEQRDAAEVLPATLPDPIDYASHREFVRRVLRNEVNLTAVGPRFVDRSQESQASVAYRTRINAEGSPSEAVAAGYVWTPGTELASKPARPSPSGIAQQGRP